MFGPRSYISTEKRTVAAMVHIYCADQHGSRRGELCETCRDLLDYSHQRLDRCPYGEEKPTCKECPVHCYVPTRRASMQEIMRAAGPKMLWRHPWLAVVHFWTEFVRRNPQRPKKRMSTRVSLPPQP